MLTPVELTTVDRTSNLTSNSWFGCCILQYYLEVYESITRVNIIASLQKGYLMKASSMFPKIYQVKVMVNFLLLIFRPNFTNIIFRLLLFHWIACEFLRRLICKIIGLQIKKKSINFSKIRKSKYNILVFKGFLILKQNQHFHKK